MPHAFFELRKQGARGTDSMVADVMRHLYSRQYLGKTLIISEQPMIIFSTARKQWLKLSRTIQKQRASTLNAEKLLKYTHTISHMQHMRFSIKRPLDEPDAEVYFLHPKDLELPPQCLSLYLLTELSPRFAAQLASDLPDQSLLIDYQQSKEWPTLGLLPKHQLEGHVTEQWQRLKQFLAHHELDANAFLSGNQGYGDALDDALDTLLGGDSHTFLSFAGEFQRALELARPLRLNRETRQHYDGVILLAHRVQALSPGPFMQQFIQVYNEDDTYFLYDVQRGRLVSPNLPELVTKHQRAGRAHLARAIQLASSL